ncbi:MAG: serine hydrolase domain-containing protein, partial [Miltoncostaeaceae bacterium]
MVSDVLERSVGELRESLGRPWGLPIPGLAAAATMGPDGRPGVAASGSSDPPGSRPLDVRDRFHIGSITKTFTAALILQLDQERRLALGDPISTWVDFPGGDRITVRMLLGHTSGIADFTDDPGYRAKQEPADLIAIAARLEPVFAPGESWAYSNTNYTMLGVISEQVTGRSWGEEVEARFLTPLGLTDTYLWQGRARPRTVDGSRVACGAAGEPDCDPARSG